MLLSLKVLPDDTFFHCLSMVDDATGLRATLKNEHDKVWLTVEPSAEHPGYVFASAIHFSHGSGYENYLKKPFNRLYIDEAVETVLDISHDLSVSHCENFPSKGTSCRSTPLNIKDRATKPLVGGGSWTYFIRHGKRGPIKIGVARDVKSRLGSLQCGSWRKLYVLGVVPHSGDTTEDAMHRRFAIHRIRGEWFRPHPDILDFITECASCDWKTCR